MQIEAPTFHFDYRGTTAAYTGFYNGGVANQGKWGVWPEIFCFYK